MTADQEKHKTVVVLMIALVLAIGSIDIYMPAMPFLANYFSVSDTIIKLTLIMSPLASCFFSIPLGHFSDQHGRRFMLLWGLFLSFSGALICGTASGIHQFFIGRFFQAFGTTAINLLTVTILADLFSGVSHARYMAIQASLFPLSYAISPIFGAYLMDCFGWRSNFLFLIFGNIILFIYCFLCFKEPPFIHNAEKSMFKKIVFLLKTPYFIRFAFGHAFPISMVAIFLVNASFLFIKIFGFSPVEFSVVQAIPVLVNFFFAFLYRYLLKSAGVAGGLRIGLAGYMLFISLSVLFFLDILPLTSFGLIGLLCIMNGAMPFVTSSCTSKVFSLTQDNRGISAAILSLLRNVLLFLCVFIFSFIDAGNTKMMLGGMIVISLSVCLLLVRSTNKINF